LNYRDNHDPGAAFLMKGVNQLASVQLMLPITTRPLALCVEPVLLEVSLFEQARPETGPSLSSSGKKT
jgi:hypothetical protein